MTERRRSDEHQPETGMRMGLQQQLWLDTKLDIALNTSQEARRRAAHRAEITTYIRMATEDCVMRYVQDRVEDADRVIDDQNFTGIVGRVAREALFQYVNEGLPLSERQKNDEDEAENEKLLMENIEDCVEQAFNHWWRNRYAFVASRNMPAEQAFIGQHGALPWSEGRPALQKLKERIAAEDSEESLPKQIVEAITSIDAAHNVKTSDRHVFERVRSASYQRITADNVDEILPRIEVCYNRVLLDAESIAKLESGDPQSRKEFVRKTRRGIFVSGFRERVNGQPSVEEQMRSDFRRKYNKDEATYEGRFLEDEGGEILAWITYYQTPGTASRKNARMIRQYLQRGVTGGKMKYEEIDQRKILEKQASETIMIDTIQGGQRDAARRLLAKVTHEMNAKSPYLKQFMGYYLEELFFQPAIVVEGREEVRLSENVSSSNFFNSLGCRVVAKDRNKKNGPRSRRVLPDGRELYLSPLWAWFVGEFQDVRKRSRDPWLDRSFLFGDISKDDLGDENIQKWPLGWFRCM